MLIILTTETGNWDVLVVSAVVLFPAAMPTITEVPLWSAAIHVIHPDLAHSVSIPITQRLTGISAQNRIQISCIQGRIDHSWAPYQRKAGALFSYAYPGFSLSGAIFFFLVVSERQHSVVKKLTVDRRPWRRGPPPMVQPAQWIIRSWLHQQIFAAEMHSGVTAVILKFVWGYGPWEWLRWPAPGNCWVLLSGMVYSSVFLCTVRVTTRH